MPRTPQPRKQLHRTEAILKVRSGQMTATEAAKQLGVSRKTYYQWEKKGLEAMMGALEDQTGGRPSTKPDPQIEQMRQDNTRLQVENSLLKQRLKIRQCLQELNNPLSAAHCKGSWTAKKNG